MKTKPFRFLCVAAHLGASLVCFAGCGSESMDGKATAEQQSPIYQGTPTSAYPEVGWLTGLPGGSCTGTLISHRYVVSAAHCLNYQLGVALNGNFRIDSAWGPRNYTVVRGWSFRFSEVGFDDHWGDVALLELYSTVPAEEASPQNLVVGANGLVTIIGYGCDQSEHGAPACYPNNTGVKRYRTGELSDGFVRRGDSGGPVYDGYLGQSRNIGGIVSAEEWDFGWYTTIADAREFRDRMLGYMRYRNWGFELGIDRPGMDLRMENQPDIWACYNACQADVWCKAFTFTDTQQCWLKWGMPQPSANSHVYTFVMTGRGTPEWGADRTATYDWAWTPTQQACMVRCASDRYCDAWTWDLAGQSSGDMCTKKWDGSQPFNAYRSNIISGTRGGINYGIDRPSNNWIIPWYTHVNARQCQAYCEEESQCTFWRNSDSGECIMYQGTPPAGVYSEFYTSGVKGQEDIL